MKNIITVLVLTLLIGSSNASELKSHCQKKPIRIAYYDIGNIFHAKNGIYEGYDFDVVSELLNRLGCKSNQFVFKRARIWNELLKEGSLDMTTSGIATPERLEKLWFVPYIQLKHSAFLNTPDGKVLSFEQFKANKFLKIGRVNGYVHSPRHDEILDQLEKEGRVVSVVDDEKLFKMLDSQGINGAISYPLVYSKYKKEKNLRGSIVATDWAASEKYIVAGLMLSKKYFTKADAILIQKIIKDLRNEGKLAEYLSKYLSKKEIDLVLDYPNTEL